MSDLKARLQDAEVVIIMLRQDLACCAVELQESQTLATFYRDLSTALVRQIVDDAPAKRADVSDEWADWFYPMGG